MTYCALPEFAGDDLERVALFVGGVEAALAVSGADALVFAGQQDERGRWVEAVARKYGLRRQACSLPLPVEGVAGRPQSTLQTGRVLWLGGAVEDSRTAEAVVRVFAMVHGFATHAKLRMVLRGMDEASQRRLKDLAARLHVSARVELCETADEPAFLDADMLLCEPASPGFDVRDVQVAQAYGLPVVMYGAFGGLPGFPAKGAGVSYVAPGDETAVAAELVRLFSNGPERRRAGEQSRANAEGAVQAYRDAWREIIEQGGSR